MEKDPTIKFSSFENFIVKTEQKENPRKMPYLACSGVTATKEQQTMVNSALHLDLQRLLQESSTDKEIINIDPSRDFLKTAWQRDSFLYFNGVYFPWRWIDTKEQNRPEREAHVLSFMGLKEGLAPDTYRKRIFKDINEGILAIGEGGLYFPDHDNNTLFISDGIIAEEGFLSKEELDNKITNTHQKIFGNDIEVMILPRPENTPHIDTHVTVIPKTKIALLENEYYKKIDQSGDLEKLKGIGYETAKIPPSDVQCPLNILYVENREGKTVAFLNSKSPSFVKNILRNHDIESYGINQEIADGLDMNFGSIRCVTSEFHSKDPEFLRKMGFKI